MQVQGSTLSDAERRAVAEFLAGRARRRHARAPRAARRAAPTSPAVTDPRRGRQLERLGQRHRQHALRAQRRPHRRRPAAAEAEVGLRLRGRARRARAADACRRATVRRQRERRSARARSEDRLHALDLQGAGRRAHGARSSARTRRPRGSGYAVFFGDARANAYAVDAHDRPRDLGAQGRRPRVGGHHRRASPSATAASSCRCRG